jgi:hypothetical protein
MPPTDTGTGMTSEVITLAFEPFFTTKPIGQGTTFKLYLPRYSGNAEQEISESDLSTSLAAENSGTVMVVEDNLIVRALIFEVLSEIGYRTAGDGYRLTGIERSPNGRLRPAKIAPT